MNISDRLPWFPCEPGPLLGALAGMRAPKQLVYMVMLLRIYESGGACPDTLDAISTRTRLNKRIVTEALDELFQEGRLFRGEDGIHNPKADRVMTESRVLFEKRKSASTKAANSKWEKHKKKQQTDGTIRNADAMQNDAHLHLHLQKESKKEDSTAIAVSSKYAFEDGVIRLNERDFKNWTTAFSQLDLAAELLSLSKWAESEGKNWFYAVKGALAKRNREVKVAKDNLKEQGGFKWNGMEGVI